MHLIGKDISESNKVSSTSKIDIQDGIWEARGMAQVAEHLPNKRRS
jgi:hypothetical protein